VRKRELPDKSVTGLVSPLGDKESTHALSLLDATPFLITESDKLIWPDPKLAKKLIRLKTGQLPDRLSSWVAAIDQEGRHKRKKALKNLTWDGAQYVVQYQLTTRDARQIWVEERGERLTGTENGATHIRGVIKNIQAQRQALRRAAFISGHDELTCLWNKARLTQGLDYLIALARRCRTQALFVRLKLSNLERINKTYGYDTGDHLLKSVADRLSEIIRVPDMVARISGITFGIGLYDTSVESLEALVARLTEQLSDNPFSTPHGDLYIELEVSATTLAENAQSAHDAFEQTHLALKQMDTSSNFNSAPIMYAPDMGKMTPKPSNTVISAEDVLDALNDRRISIAYQPIIDAQTRDLHHYECLLRLRTNAGEVVSAGQFIMAAEQLGLIDLLDRRALELASEPLRQFPDIHLALNVSAGTVQDEGTAQAYIAALKALGPDVSRITLELTETVALEDPAMASRFSVETRTLGCKFAIDDFGAGYTTFRNLMAIEADTIKIDGSFIQNLSQNSNNQTFVRMMVDLAQTFSVKTVAEMVDNRKDAELLKRLGVDYLQGYLFGIPSAAPAWQQMAS